MKIEAKVFPIDAPQGATVAFAKVTLDAKITINNVRVINGQNGLFISMPQERDKDDNWRDIVKIENKDVYNSMNEAVLGSYVVASQRKNSGADNRAQSYQTPPQHQNHQPPQHQNHQPPQRRNPPQAPQTHHKTQTRSAAPDYSPLPNVEYE
jgi:stage V sporulation protein G